MRIKIPAIAIIMFSAIVTFAGVSFASAQGYTPLVQIPGIPLGPVNLSLYLVGLYDFLLSVVGIVAVLMLIVGGMRYITAAGNQAAVSDAKDIITNALIGLLLAILSWVIVAEINPDVLYIKKPSGKFAATVPWMHGKCMDITVPPCVCKDGTPIAVFANVKDCDSKCRTQGHCGLEEMKCTFPTSYDVNDGDLFYNSVDKGGQGGKCHCADGMFVEIDYANPAAVPPHPGAPADATCEGVCSTPDWAGTYNDGDGPAGEYHGISWRLKVGQYDINNVRPIAEGENFSVEVGKPVYFDLSEIKDCKGNLVHFVLEFEGGRPAWGNILDIPDEWCCMQYNSGCSGSWGTCCNNNGGSVANVWAGDIGCLWDIPECKDDSYMNTPNSESESYPIYIYDSYNTVSSTKTPPAPEEVWIGISVEVGGRCEEFQRNFRVDVVSP